MTSLDFIDLSSDEEDCMIGMGAEAELAEATFSGSDKDSRKSYCIPETPKLEAVEQPINESDSGKGNPLIVNPIKQVHTLSAQAHNSSTQFDHRGLVQTPHRDSRRSSSGWQQHSAETGLCREFWKAGDYDVRSTGKTTLQNGMDHVRVHPKFLHSIATSHEWALGAIAGLLDNSVDEINNGATFVNVDKIACPRDNIVALLVQDDGGGMDPDCMRQCMSTISQYGNGFKKSTMRLGADVIVFSTCYHNSIITQSIGLLSYTFLRETGHEDIVVPMVDYETSLSGQRKRLIRSTPEDWSHNLSTLLQWSPYTLESDLLKQFDDIGPHGTKVIVYNLWLNDDGQMELDFESDKEDIQLRGEPNDKQLSQRHIANRLRYSLRVYSSILYLRIPDNFKIFLRGRVVEHHKIANDLKFPEYILYTPQIDNNKDVSVITTIGFTKEAPLVNVHGFNVYHKNRLIMPFWKAFRENSSKGRGVVGVLEANFIEPANGKQDFEKTAVLLRLQNKLKSMTTNYWNSHCALIGYQPSSAKPNRSQNAPSSTSGPTSNQPAGASTHNHSVGPYEAVRQTIASSSAFPGMSSAGIGSTLSQMASASSNFLPYAAGSHMDQRNAENFETKPTILRPGVVNLSPVSSIPPNLTDNVKPSITRVALVSGKSPNTGMSQETPSVQINSSITIAVGRTANAAASPPTPSQQSSDIEMKDQGRNEESGSSLKRKQPSNGSLSALANGCPSTLLKTKWNISEVTSSDELEVPKRQASGTRNNLQSHDHLNVQLTLDNSETGSIPITKQLSTTEDESGNCQEFEVLLEQNKKLQAQDFTNPGLPSEQKNRMPIQCFGDAGGMYGIQPVSLHHMVGAPAMGLNSVQMPTASGAAIMEVSGGVLPRRVTGNNDRCTILVANLNTEKIDEDKLFNLFSIYGNILRIKLLRNKPDHALIQMADGFQAELAVIFLKGALLFGKHLEISFSKLTQIHPSSDSTDYSGSKLNRFSLNLAKNYRYYFAPTKMIHVSALPADVTEVEVVSHLEEHGNIINSRLFEANGKKQAHILFENVDQATEALVCKHASTIDNSTIILSFSPVQSISAS